MTKKIIALLVLTLSLAACDSSSTETNSNANNPAKANTTDQVSPTPLPSPSPAPSTSVKSQLKAGDKVKVASNGSLTDATIVSVDDKSGKVTVKLQGQSEEKTVSIGDIIRQ